MSHKTAKSARRAALMAATREMVARGSPAIPAPSGDLSLFSGGWGAGNGHQGADDSRLRSYVYFPELDTRREISSYTRTEILRKVRFLMANQGIAKRCVYGLARMVAGTGLTPQATTADREWNSLAERAFATSTGTAQVFDVGGRYNFAKAQQAVLRWRYRDGDCATVFTSSESGRARFAFYEGHQIGNASRLSAGFDQNEWRDGVRHDANNRAIQYRFLADDPTRFTDVSAADVAFFCDYERGGQSRGLSILSHAINHLLDSAEITSYIKTGVKLSNQHGYWMQYAPGTTKPPSSAAARVGGNGNATTVQTNAGPVTFKQITGGGAIPDLPPGAELKFNNSAHPHPNNLSLLEFLIRDIAWGAGVAPELLWNIASLGGANTRFVMADAQGWIEEQQAELVRLFNSRVWVYTIAKEIKAGRLRPCADVEWWKHAWIPPPRLTVDIGRDGKLHLEMLKMGAITYTRLLGWQQQDFEVHTEKWLDELAFIKAGLNAGNAAAFKPGADRNLTWDDVQQWRNAVGFRPDAGADATVAPGNPDASGDAAAQLEALLKNPSAALAEIARLRAQPEAA